MTLGVIIIVAVLLVLGFGLLIFWLMRRSQKVVPDVADERVAKQDHVVAVDEQGRQIMASQEPVTPARDAAAFDNVLRDEIQDLGQEPPAANDD